MTNESTSEPQEDEEPGPLKPGEREELVVLSVDGERVPDVPELIERYGYEFHQRRYNLEGELIYSAIGFKAGAPPERFLPEMPEGQEPPEE